jgi:hypothetical protein
MVNGNFWWDSWTASAPAVAIDAAVKERTELDEIAVFVSGHVNSAPPFTLRGFSSGSPTTERNLGSSPKVSARHSIGGYDTTVFVFDATGISGDLFRLTFDGSQRPSLREINLHFDQRKRLDDYYASLIPIFGDI